MKITTILVEKSAKFSGDSKEDLSVLYSEPEKDFIIPDSTEDFPRKEGEGDTSYIHRAASYVNEHNAKTIAIKRHLSSQNEVFRIKIKICKLGES